MSNINKLKLINLNNYKEVNGNLIVIEFKKKKFIPKRIFQVYAGAGKIRGKHV